MNTIVTVAESEQDLNQVRALFRAFLAWHRNRHSDDMRLIDAYFDEGQFETELRTLPGKYSPPDGQLLIARVDGNPAGCLALRRRESGFCEMKRMFVDPGFQGRGVGTALAQAIILQAQRLNFSVMQLDTSLRQKEAMQLYGKLGFREVEPYYAVSAELRAWLVFMELKLPKPGAVSPDL